MMRRPAQVQEIEYTRRQCLTDDDTQLFDKTPRKCFIVT